MSRYNSDEEWSTIGGKTVLEFLDFEEEKTLCSCIPDERDSVVISVPFAIKNGRPQSFYVGSNFVSEITIKNTTKEPINLWSVHIHASSPENCFTLSLMKPPATSANVDAEGFIESSALEDRMLQPDESLRVWLSCKTKEIGMHSSIVYFDAGDERIERVVFLLVEDHISLSMAHVRPYSKERRKGKFVEDTSYSVAVSRPPFKRELIESNQIPPVVEQGLTRNNYASFFKALMMIDEMQLEKDIRSYDIQCITMRRIGNQQLSMEVPGLAEERPSLVLGDCIFASEYGGNTKHVHQGSIQRVQANEIYVKFDPKFEQDHKDGNLYDIRLSYDGTNKRRLYQAVEAAEKYLRTEFLFPGESPRRRCIQTNTLVPICDENFDEKQMSCAQKILGSKGGSPYVILGPPGTGKTKTLVETILQLCYNRRTNARVLVCAPSNVVADYMMEQLLSQNGVQFTEDQVLRLNASNRPFGDVKPEHIRFCYFEDFSFKCPPRGALLRYRIIVSTLISASLLYAEGVAPGQFSHILLDDVSQASEPETMVPLSNLCTKRTVVVLVGDPIQLGPVISSQKAEEHGLGKSFLERLIGYEVYFSGDNNYVTKLVRNYRCHPKILHLPSMLFYNGELVACKDETTFMVNEDLLPNKEFPILFFGIQGYDEFRVGNNSTWFNRVEASKVIEVVRRLMGSGNTRQEDIGIITPYKQQELKIKEALTEFLNMHDIKVGSVEQFQGQEKEVIIISTVRSTFKHQELDKVQHVGFLSNPRRFNVAVTRAKSLLVIVGNPHIICKDYYWNKMLWHCVDNSSYQGCPLPRRPEPCHDEGTRELA